MSRSTRRSPTRLATRAIGASCCTRSKNRSRSTSTTQVSPVSIARRAALTAWWALRPGRKPKLRSENEGSKIGERTWLNACWRKRSGDRRHAQLALPAPGLGDRHPADGARLVRARVEALADLRPGGLQVGPKLLHRDAVGIGGAAVAFDAPQRPGEVLSGEEALPEVHDPGGVRDRHRRRRIGAALCAGSGRLHRPPPDAGPPAGWDGRGPCADRECSCVGPRTDVWPFPAMLIPAGTMAAADSCRVHRRLAAATVGGPCTRHPDRSPRIRTAAVAPAPPHLPDNPLVVSDITVLGRLIRVAQPRMRFVFLGSEPCLGLPSDPTSR